MKQGGLTKRLQVTLSIAALAAGIISGCAAAGSRRATSPVANETFGASPQMDTRLKAVIFNLIDSLPGIILFMAATSLPMAIWRTKNFMDSVPLVLEGAAWVAGAVES